MRRYPTCEQRGAITALYLVTLDIEVFVVVDNSIYLLLFYKFILGSSGAMQLCMFFTHGRRVARTVFIFYPLIVIPTLIGVSQQVEFSSHFFPSKTGKVGFCPFYLVLKGVSQHL